MNKERFTEFTYAEAVELAHRNMFEGVPSVSRVLLAELDTLRRQLAEAEAKLVGAQERTQILFEAKIKWADRAHAAEAKLALAEQDGKRLDYMLHWHATTLTDGNGWRVAFEYTSPATYATIKKYQTQREAIDAAIAAGEVKGD